MNGYYDFNKDEINNDFEHEESKRMTREKKEKKKRKAFAAKCLAGALVVGMGGGAIAYAGCNYIAGNTAYVESSDTAVSGTTTDTADTSTTTTTTALTTDTSSDATSVGTVSDVAASAIKSLVTLTCTGETEMQSYFGGSQMYEYSSAGSGVIIYEDDTNIYMVTNAHVIEDATTITVGFVDESEATASVIGSDTSNDIAVVAVAKSDVSSDTLSAISIATIGDSDSLELGDQVVAIGNALGYGQSVTSGYVSAFDRSLTLSDSEGNTFESTGLIQTDASINSGNSGGGLFNMSGELIAINEAKSSTTSSGVTVDNMGYAIPMSKAWTIIESMINGTYSSDSSSSDSASGAYLGVTVAEISEQASMMYNLPSGVYVSSVEDGSPAQTAGLQTGDIITAVGDTTISSYDDLSSALSSLNSGDTVTMTIYRTSNGAYQAYTVDVTLGSAA